MWRAILIFALMACVSGPLARRASAQIKPAPESPPAPRAATQAVDGIAARIEEDIITESEVRELTAFQQLVDGRTKSRVEVIQELADQWIVRGEAALAAFPQPSKEDVDRAYSEFMKQFPSPAEFMARYTAVGLTEAAVRRILEQQLFLSRFIDYRFRPAAQVDDKQIESYYQNEFIPQLKAKNTPVPPLDDVEDTIREVLIQRAISDRAAKWLNDTRASLKIDIVSQGAAS